jgi:hypothetical protein
MAIMTASILSFSLVKSSSLNASTLPRDSSGAASTLI